MLTVQLAKNKIENEEGMNHILVRVKPEESKSKNEKPVAFFLVVDVSYSMNDLIGDNPYRIQPALHHDFFSQTPNHQPRALANHQERNTKLDFVKQASEKLIDSMRDSDQLGIVSFSNIASLESGLIELNRENRSFLKDRIRSLQVRGATNVSDGMELAFSQIPNELKETHHIKLILLSDGEANHGIVDPDGISTVANRFRKQDVHVSTIGVGNDYNSFFMESIATASGGMFYHLKELTALNDIFTRELTELTNLTTKNVKITIQTPSGVHIAPNMNGFIEEQNGEITLGNLFNEQTVISELFTDTKIANQENTVTVRIDYTDMHDQQKSLSATIPLLITDEENMDDVTINKEVTDIVKDLLASQAKKETIRFYEVGDLQNATTNIQASMDKIGSLQAHYSIDTNNLMDDMASFQTSIESRQLNKEQSKALYSQSYRALRDNSK